MINRRNCDKAHPDIALQAKDTHRRLMMCCRRCCTFELGFPLSEQIRNCAKLLKSWRRRAAAAHSCMPTDSRIIQACGGGARRAPPYVRWRRDAPLPLAPRRCSAQHVGLGHNSSPNWSYEQSLSSTPQLWLSTSVFVWPKRTRLLAPGRLPAANGPGEVCLNSGGRLCWAYWRREYRHSLQPFW